MLDTYIRIRVLRIVVFLTCTCIYFAASPKKENMTLKKFDKQKKTYEFLMLSEKKTRVFSGIFFFLTCIFHTDQNDTEWTCLYTLWFTPNIFVQSGICGAHIHHHHSPSLLSVMACLCQWSTKLSWSTITYHLIGYGCCTIFFLNLTLTFSFSISLFFFFPPLLFQFIFFSFSFSFRNWHRQSPAPSKYVQKRLRQGLYRVLYHTSHYNMHNVFFKFLCDASLYHFFFFFYNW